jgi:zinc finger protein
MTFANCSECKYKTSDILPLEKRTAPEKQEKKISSEKDLHIRIVKSKHATIYIPEIKLKIEPGPGSEAYISNVEGLLLRIIKKIQGFKKIHPEKEKDYEKIIDKLTKMKQSRKKFTLVFKDKTGQSAILTEELKNE